MNLKDVSIVTQEIEIHQAITASRTDYPNAPKGDVFLLGDFKDNLNRKVELQRNLDGKTFEGTLESIKIDIDPFTKDEWNSILYLIKLKEINTPFEIQSDSIDYNQNYQRKYYFKIKNNIEWRIVFFK